MALVNATRSTFNRTGAVKSLLGAQNACPSAAAAPIQVATMKATYGEPYPYKNPFPYKTKYFGVFSQFFDNARRRMCENSKIIVVDGNCAVGKNEFAQRLAKDFDLQFIPAATDAECFKLVENNFDLRELNEILPQRCHFYDWEAFLTQKNGFPHGFVGRLQLQWYFTKWKTYAFALQHLFHTGQGAVIVRSPFSDHVFAEAMYKCGYVTRNYMDYYDMFVRNSLCEVLKPHLAIYLDTSLDVIKERMKKRGNKAELESPMMSDKFLQAIDDTYKNKFLTAISRESEVLEIDWTEIADELDMDAICVEIENLRLDAENASDPRFQDWYEISEDKLNYYRRAFGDPQFQHNYVTRPLPTNCPEIMYNAEDFQEMYRKIEHHPAVKYAPGTSPQLGNSRFNLW